MRRSKNWRKDDGWRGGKKEEEKVEEKVEEKEKAAPVVMTPRPVAPKRVIKIYRGTEDPEEIEVKR